MYSRKKKSNKYGVVIGEAGIGSPTTNPALYIAVTRVVH